MAGAPINKIYDAAGKYLGCVKTKEAAAVLVASEGKGAKVLLNHDKKAVLWHEGFEEFSASESFDRAAAVMEERHDKIYQEKWGSKNDQQ